MEMPLEAGLDVVWFGQEGEACLQASNRTRGGGRPYSLTIRFFPVDATYSVCLPKDQILERHMVCSDY